jgi:hypothetical protein
MDQPLRVRNRDEVRRLRIFPGRVLILIPRRFRLIAVTSIDDPDTGNEPVDIRFMPRFVVQVIRVCTREFAAERTRFIKAKAPARRLAKELKGQRAGRNEFMCPTTQPVFEVRDAASHHLVVDRLDSHAVILSHR